MTAQTRPSKPRPSKPRPTKPGPGPTSNRTRALHLTTVAVTGLAALTGYAGAVGLVVGDLTFGPTINARLPFDSLVLAGGALTCFVALPMTVAAVAVARRLRRGPDLVFSAGLLLVAWIGVQLAFIKTYSWFQPVYLLVALVVLSLSWLMSRSAVQRLPEPGSS